jgi:hypothetical protein
VPGVLADQDRGTSPAGIERLYTPPSLDEALLVEDTIGWKKHFAVHVADPGIGPAERGVEA